MRSKLFLSVLIASTFPLAACAQDTWLGTYQYVTELGENVSEDKVIVEYIFRLTSQECKITAQGYQTDEAIFNLANGNEIKVDNELSEDRSNLEKRIRDDFIQSIKNKGVDCPEPKPAYSYLTDNDIVFVNYSDQSDSVQCEVEARIPHTVVASFVKRSSVLSKLIK